MNPGPMGSVRWWDGRSVLLHLGLLVSLPTCVLATYWQVGRALSGNVLSWAYSFEWPGFAALAVWVWWALLRLPANSSGRAAAPRVAGPSPRRTRSEWLLERRSQLPEWSTGVEGSAVRAYNDYLRAIQQATPQEMRRMARPRRKP
jgi:hypothetical protein